MFSVSKALLLDMASKSEEEKGTARDPRLMVKRSAVLTRLTIYTGFRPQAKISSET